MLFVTNSVHVHVVKNNFNVILVVIFLRKNGESLNHS
jgi:hypothetical protein